MTLADMNDKIAKNVTEGFDKMSHTAVKGYKTTENTALNLWEKTEHFFVGNLFRKEGETVEEAQKRLQGASAHE